VYNEMDLRETGLGGMDWIDVAQDKDQYEAFMNIAADFRIP
jgi:hypothetical protein